MNYSQLSKEELRQIYDLQKGEYDSLVAQGYSVDIARGKPCNEQLDISMPMLAAEGIENMPKSYRNYGMLDGIPEMKKIFADMLEVDPSQVILGGSSSLNLMYDTIQRALQFGVTGGKPWNSAHVKFLCPVPGYDRHFAICEHFGIEMISIPMNEEGPNMDLVEQLVANDDAIKGMWCVPKYSNPTGITYSDAVVERLANMKTKADDFRIFWDNAYVVHDLAEVSDHLANIMVLCDKAGHPNRVYQFASTSKVTLAGAGVSCIATGKDNVKDILSHMTMQTISYNKVWQYIHYLFLKDMDNVRAIMAKQREIIKPKFDTLITAFEDSFGSDSGIASWTNPNGGYFITLDVLDGCAKRVCELCKKAGLTLTAAGAPFPYGIDVNDRTLRIAPTFTSDSDLIVATRILTCCVKLACVEKLIDIKVNAN